MQYIILSKKNYFLGINDSIYTITTPIAKINKNQESTTISTFNLTNACLKGMQNDLKTSQKNVI